MDIKSLRLFQHLASSLHFSKTATAMYVSAPTLSRVISRLEQECKATLFVRNNRSVILTSAGRSLLSFANETLTQYSQMLQNMQSEQKALTGELSLYCSVTASQSYMPDILEKLHRQYPLVDIKLDTGDHTLAIEKVMKREVDLALAIHIPDFPSHMHFAKLDTVPLMLIVPKNMNVDTWQAMQWQSANMILPARGPSRRILQQWFAEQSIKPHVYAQVSGNEAIVSMVALGLGIGFVPSIVLENSVVKNKVKVFDVDSIEPYQLGLCYLNERASEPLMKAVSQLLVS